MRTWLCIAACMMMLLAGCAKKAPDQDVYGEQPPGDSGVVEETLDGGSPAGEQDINGIPPQTGYQPGQSPQYQGSEVMFQAGSFAAREHAEQLRDSLVSQGFSAFVEEAVVVSGVTYRVVAGRAGPEDMVRSALQNAGVAYPILYTSYEKPGSQSMPSAPGVTFQIGSFSQRENAENLSARVAANGFQTRVEQSSAGGATLYKVLASRAGSEADVRSLLSAMGIQSAVLVRGAGTPTPASPSYDTGPELVFQAGAFSSRANAMNLSDRINSFGLSASVQEASGASGVLYKVIVRGAGSEDGVRMKLLEAGVPDPIRLH